MSHSSLLVFYWRDDLECFARIVLQLSLNTSKGCWSWQLNKAVKHHNGHFLWGDFNTYTQGNAWRSTLHPLPLYCLSCGSETILVNCIICTVLSTSHKEKTFNEYFSWSVNFVSIWWSTPNVKCSVIEKQLLQSSPIFLWHCFWKGLKLYTYSYMDHYSMTVFSTVYYL